MRASIMDKGHMYQYDKMIHVSVINGNELIIRYQDEEGENHEEVGDIPEYLAIQEDSNMHELKILNEAYLEEIRSLKKKLIAVLKEEYR